jgi:hypothetical protein
MGKKCIPGLICIENMTLFILIVMLIMVIYLFFLNRGGGNDKIIVINQRDSREDNIMNDLYAPPLKNDGVFFPIDSGDFRGQPPKIAVPVSVPISVPVNVPINMQTRGFSSSYSQIGILTRTNGGGDMILPLMGRRIMNGRSKMQYYTISNTGNMNTKLPISVNGKSCTGEYGCDEISNGDVVYVEGYKDTFQATIYENGLFSYIPAML